MDFDDVEACDTDKMIRRHPHVFGGPEQRAAGQTDASWERIKADERAQESDRSAMAGVAMALPALKRAQKLGKRASTVGFDWPDRHGVREKIVEELSELEAAVGTRDVAAINEEFGDLLFALVNMSRHLDIDPEQALSAANAKFEQRFRNMEKSI